MSGSVKFGGGLVETKMMVYARPAENEEMGFKLMLVDPNHKWFMNDEDVHLDTVSITFRAPDDLSYEEMILKAVQTLRDKQQQKLARAQREVNELQEKIDAMLLLTHQPTEPELVTPSSVPVEPENDLPF